MKKLFQNSTWEYLFILLGMTLPFGPALPNLAIGLIGLVWLIQLLMGKCRMDRSHWIAFFILSAYTFYCVSTYWYSENHGYFWKKAGLQLLIPLLAMVCLSIPFRASGRSVRRVLRAFIFSLALLAVLSLGKQIWSVISEESSSWSLLLFDQLASAVGSIHYLTLSLYTCFAIAAGFYLLFLDGTAWRPDRYRRIIRVCMFLLTVFLFLLGSRIAIVTAIALVLIILSIQARRAGKYMTLISAIAILGVLTAITLTSETMQDKWKEVYQFEDDSSGSGYWGGTGMRVLIWDCAWKVIQNNPVLGVGMGDDLDQMTLCYRVYSRNQLLVEGNSFHAHNIFLQAWVRSGIIGLLLLMGSLVWTIVYSVRYQNPVYLLFIATFVLLGMTESFFQINAGVLFFAFFSAFLFCYKFRSE
ncbi:O-antigen ligase family protein [Aureitalea marina]|uniref:O-antigen ligase-related domain-containing protein n=1 Tax=Aureitalea marina TaxID=930804 RepID=A0A2S7KS85_9FLAO|nr:O-antigen ligase family protein [Aureitalea marina]PQB05489.1 hypothetical protein BST85_11745 [Aureitalea marina]